MRDINKRRQLFRVLKEKNADVIFIQETHCTTEAAHPWQNELGGKIYNAFGESNARGVAILTKCNFPYNCYDILCDERGRFISLKIVNETTKDEAVLCNIYAPNSDVPEFFISVIEYLN